MRRKVYYRGKCNYYWADISDNFEPEMREYEVCKEKKISRGFQKYKNRRNKPDVWILNH
jgi:hypothetical protein